MIPNVIKLMYQGIGTIFNNLIRNQVSLYFTDHISKQLSRFVLRLSFIVNPLNFLHKLNHII